MIYKFTYKTLGANSLFSEIHIDKRKRNMKCRECHLYTSNGTCCGPIDSSLEYLKIREHKLERILK